MLNSWLAFLIYALFALAIPASMVAMSFVFATRPRRRTRARTLPFESGVSQGPPHQSHFTSRFKQATGLTPTRWRRFALDMQATPEVAAPSIGCMV